MKTGDHKKKASRPFWFSWQVVLEPTSPSFTVPINIIRRILERLENG